MHKSHHHRHAHQPFPMCAFHFIRPGAILLLVVGLLLLGFPWWLLIVLCCLPFSWKRRGSYHLYGDHRKRKHEDYDDDKPKRRPGGEPRYIRTPDGEWLEVI